MMCGHVLVVIPQTVLKLELKLSCDRVLEMFPHFIDVIEKFNLFKK